MAEGVGTGPVGDPHPGRVPLHGAPQKGLVQVMATALPLPARRHIPRIGAIISAAPFWFGRLEPSLAGHRVQGGAGCASADTSRLEPDAERALSRLGEGQCPSMRPAYVSRASVTCSKRGAKYRANVALAETRGSGRHVEAELEHPVCRQVVAGPRNQQRLGVSGRRRR